MEKKDFKNLIDEFYFTTKGITYKDIYKVVEAYKNSNLTKEEIQKRLSEQSQKMSLNYTRKIDYLNEMAYDLKGEIFDTRNLKLNYNGITLSSITIDLLNITEAKSIGELKEVLNTIMNLNVDIETKEFRELSLADIKKLLIKKYRDDLLPYDSINDSYQIINHTLEKTLRMMNIKEKEKRQLYEKYKKIQKDYISKGATPIELYERIKEEVNTEYFKEDLYLYITQLDFVAPPGIKKLRLEDLEKLSELIDKDYNSITVTDALALPKISSGLKINNKFIHNSKTLIKAIEYAKKHKKHLMGNPLFNNQNFAFRFVKQDHEEVVEELISYIKFICHYAENLPYISCFSELIYSGDNLVPLREIEITSATDQETIEKLKDISYPYVNRNDLRKVPEIITGKKDDYNYYDFQQIKRYLNIFEGCFSVKEYKDRLYSFFIREIAWREIFSLEEICTRFNQIKKELPNNINIKFLYSDYDFENRIKRKEIIKELKKPQNIDSELIDGIGINISCGVGGNIDTFLDAFKDIHNELGLPIYIESLEIYAQESLVKELEEDKISGMEIERLRALTLKNLFAAIAEAKKLKIKIESITITLLTDLNNYTLAKYNSKVPLNKKVSTNHSGFYNEDYSKKYVIQLKRDESITSLHNHTIEENNKSNIIPTQEFVDTAKKLNITTLGFSNFLPYPKLILPNEYMSYNDLDKYITTIDTLNTRNKDINILCGFECDYSQELEGFLCDLRNKSDYLILGRRLSGIVVKYDNNPNLPLAYAAEVEKAIRTGLFDIIAYPDYFMNNRDTVLLKKDKELFLENARLAVEKICDVALEFDIPIEFNYSSIEDFTVLDDGNLSYNHPMSWEIIKEKGCRVMYGIGLNNFNKMNLSSYYKTIADYIVEPTQLKLVKGDYNPAEYRKTNDKLQKALLQTAKNTLSYETIVTRNNLKTELENSTNYYKSIVAETKKTGEHYKQNAIIRKEFYKKQITNLETSEYSEIQKQNLKNRYLRTIKEIDETYKYQKTYLKYVVASAALAKENGCISKEAYTESIVNSIEAKYGTTDERREQAVKNVLYTRGKRTVQDLNEEITTKGIANYGMIIILLTLLGLVSGYLIYWFTT